VFSATRNPSTPTGLREIAKELPVAPARIFLIKKVLGVLASRLGRGQSKQVIELQDSLPIGRIVGGYLHQL
jgi:hypothetical protein